jgi:hypothetical protein
MSITNGYATLTEVKSTDVLNFSNTDHDTILESVIEGVSRAIDNWCGRHFYSASETRYYTTKDPYCVRVHDISTASGLSVYTDVDGDGTFENTLASTDYNLMPYNALLENWVYTKIEKTPLGLYIFPLTRRGIKVTATFGWPSVPKPINRACVLQSARLFARYKTPLGQAGASPIGMMVLTIPEFDPDVIALLSPYKKIT